MAIVCEGYLGVQVCRENFVDIKRVIRGLVDELPEEGFTPRLLDTYWTKGVANWLAGKVPTMTTWEGSRLKMVGLDALPTYKRVVAWLSALWRIQSAIFVCFVG
jgi:hypothetical protein